MILFLSSLGLGFFLLVLFVFFFNQGLSPAFDFSMSKDFSIDRELPCVNLVE